MPEPGPGARVRWPLVAGAGLAVFMAMLDTYIVTVALPSIGAEFHAGPGALQWVVLGYFLPAAALALPVGRWLDGIGHRPALLLAVAGFAGASLACALAGGLAVLVLARVLQGGFAAVLTALAPALATVAAAPAARARAMSVITTLGPLGALAGPALGGWLTQAAGWRALFLVNLPVSGLIAVLAVWTLPPAPVAGRLRWPGAGSMREAGVLGGAMLGLIAGLTLAVDAGWGWLVLAVPALPLLWWWRRLPTSASLRHLLRERELASSVLALALISTATSGLIFLLPFFLTLAAGVGPARAGLVLSALPLAMVALAPAAGVLADRSGARGVSLTGAVVVVAGLVALVPLDPAWSTVDLAWRLALTGAGMAAFVGPNQTRIMALAPTGMLATAGGGSGLARTLGFGLGPALVTVVWTLGGLSTTGSRLAVGSAALVAGSALAVLLLRTAPGARAPVPGDRAAGAARECGRMEP